MILLARFLSRNWLVPVMAFIILLLLTLVGWGVKLYYGQLAQNRYAVVAAARLETEKSLQNTLIRRSRDSLGRLISTLRTTEISRDAALGLSQVQGGLINRQLRAITTSQRDLMRVARNLKSATTIHVDAQGDFLAVMQDTIILTEGKKYNKDTLIARYDTVKVFAKTFHYRDAGGWFEMKGIVTNDTVQFTPSYRDRINIVTYRERRPRRHPLDLFRRKHTVVRYKSENPYSSLTEFQKVIVEK